MTPIAFLIGAAARVRAKDQYAGRRRRSIREQLGAALYFSDRNHANDDNAITGLGSRKRFSYARNEPDASLSPPIAPLSSSAATCSAL